MHILSGDKSLTRKWPSISAVAVGALLILLSIFWRPSTGSGAALMQTLNQWGSNPAPYAVILLLFWGYLQTLVIQRNAELATFRNDQHSIAEVLDRLVLPRTLSQSQANSAVQYLQNFPPQDVTIEVIQGDGEASSYAAQFNNLFTRAGWSLKWKWSTDIPNGGLGIDFIQTMAHNQIPADFKNPKVDLLLKMALGYAGIYVDGGTSGGTSISTTEDCLTLKIGPRRKDNLARRI